MPVKQSASKEEFLKALALDVNRPDDKQKFSQLWQEVTSYWCRNFETDARDILKPEYAVNSAVHRPYKWAHLSQHVIDRAIQEIWQQGAQWPRYYYDLGRSDDARIYNWVLKWLLWHVCRYRDWRNRKGRGGSTSSKSASVGIGGGSGRGSSGGHSCFAGSSGSAGGEGLPTQDFWKVVMNERSD